MSSARSRSAVFATAVVTSLALAAPAASAARPHPRSTMFDRHGLRSTSLRLAHGQLAHVDTALLGRHGTVDVMLQLAPAPAVVSYAAVKAPRSRLASLRVSAFRGQVGRIHTAQRAVTARLGERATRAQTLFTLHNLYDGVAVRTDASRLPALAKLPGVVGIHALVPKRIDNAVTVPLIGAPTAWQGVNGDIGIKSNGQPIRIGIIDTGIDYTHADFGGPGTVAAYDAARASDTMPAQYPDPAKVAGGYDFAGDSYDSAAGLPGNPDTNPADATPKPDPNPLDCSGHGSHVAGTAAGFGVRSDGSTYGTNPDGTVDPSAYTSLGSLSSTQYQSQFNIGPGVAPGAQLFALKIFGCAEESSTGSDLIAEALDWAVDPNGDGNPADHLDVVNMSLGADFTTNEDPDAVAADNASLAGVTVVAAAGNAGDEFNAAGAPGNAVRAISVAASDDTTDLVDGVTFSDVAGNQGAEESSAYDWQHGATAGAGFSKQLVTVGSASTLATWRTPSDTNNSDGCQPYSTADAAKAAGKIVLLSWTDNDSARRCGSATRTDNAFKAGALGVVLADDEDEFSAGILGTSDIPTVITTKTAGDKVATDVLAGTTVTATLSAALHNAVKDVHDGTNGTPDTTNAVATFSSRGTASAGLLKPDIAAPGVTVFSALYGSGNDGTSNNGTSMATPHVTGSAALVKAVHPAWTPEQVKAALMNTAGQDVYARAADGSANHNLPEAPERVGAGRVSVDKAVNDGVLAYATNASGAVSVSFGTITTATATTLSRAITLQNTSANSVSYAVSYDVANINPGATYGFTTTTCGAAQPTLANVTVPANGTAQVTVCLTIDPSQLTASPDPTLTMTPSLASPYDIFNGVKRAFLSTASGRVVFTAPSGTLRVPVYAAPRAAATMTQAASLAVSSAGTGSVALHGVGLNQTPAAGSPDVAVHSTVDAFELQGANGALPICKGTATPPGCAPTSGDRAGDLKYVGFASDGPLYHAAGFDPWALDPAGDGSVPPAFVYFGLATNWSWTSPDFGIYAVWIDLNGDGAPDAVVYNTRIPGTDIFVAELANVDSTGTPQFVYDDELLDLSDGSSDPHLFDSDVMTMPVAAAALKEIAVDDGFLAPKASQPDPAHPSDPDNYVDPNNRISYFVDSGTIDAGFLDSIGDPIDGGTPMSTDIATPGLYASVPSECNDPSSPTPAPVCFPTLIDDQNGTALTVQTSSAFGADRPLGLLLLHGDDVNGTRAQVVKFATSVSAPSPTIPYGDHYRMTVRVSSSLGVPGGSVSVYEGSTRLAAGTLHSGTVAVTLPARSLGRHTLSVRYSGDAAHSASSRTVTLTVTKASTRTYLSLSGTSYVALTATTTVVSPGRAGISGHVHFYDNGHWFATVSTTGKVTVHRRLSRGRHTLTARYFGSTVLYGSSGSRSHTV